MNSIRISLCTLAVTIAIGHSDVSLAGQETGACLDTIHRYAVEIDNKNAEGVAELFTEDASFILPTQSAISREEIKRGVSEMPQDRRTLHHVTTASLKATGKNTMEGTVYLILHVSPMGEGAAQPITQHGVYTDIYELTEGECRIKSRVLKMDPQ